MAAELGVGEGERLTGVGVAFGDGVAVTTFTVDTVGAGVPAAVASGVAVSAGDEDGEVAI